MSARSSLTAGIAGVEFRAFNLSFFWIDLGETDVQEGSKNRDSEEESHSDRCQGRDEVGVSSEWRKRVAEQRKCEVVPAR
jgi:hypothetical protein